MAVKSGSNQMEIEEPPSFLLFAREAHNECKIKQPYKKSCLWKTTPAISVSHRKPFKEGKILNNLSVVTNGVEAMAFLRREGRYQNAPRPELILLDLNLPKKDGREVLAEIKTIPI